MANKKPGNQRAGLRPRVQPGKAKTTFKSAKAPQGKLKSPAKKTANQGKAKAISQALALKRLNKVRVIDNTNHVILRNRKYNDNFRPAPHFKKQ